MRPGHAERTRDKRTDKATRHVGPPCLMLLGSLLLLVCCHRRRRSLLVLRRAFECNEAQYQRCKYGAGNAIDNSRSTGGP